MKPRILFVLRYHYLRYTGGAEMQAAMMARELAARGWDVHYASETVALPETNPLDGVTLHALPENPSYWKGNREPLRRLLTELQPDVVYTRTFDPYVGNVVRDKPQKTVVMWAAASKNDGRAWPFLVQGWRMLPVHLFVRRMPVFLYWNSIARKGRAGADIVLAQHRDQQEQLARLGVKSVVLRNSHPDVPATDMQSHDGVPIILWADSIKAIKRPELFLDLAKRCSDLNAQFVMIGKSYDEHYDRLIESTREAVPSFRYDGFVPLADVNRYFRAAHVHVKTSLPIEGFPNTFVQAWLHGVPVASLEVDPERLIRTHLLGQYVESVDKLERAVRELVTNPALRRQLGRNARQFAVQEFNLQKNMDKFEQLVGERLRLRG